ncbi:MAG TPA: TIGR00730 family Rossman fold protein [Ferruginibacter sp.]|nr:TIGR00730 family Rossman fold protein [Ferruginibacter sp.]HRO17085.1 TIGR00730 family Rossman fold protein [Ferruginibacter sp.]HRQ20162.1 TIGR00730 family Rossman fold protein [Ferruginibacter sp.]
MPIQAIAVFCGSKSGADPLYEQHAIHLGSLLANKGVNIIYGGGNKGLMGAVANAAIAHRGNVIGIMPEILRDWEHHHQGLSELLIVDSMHTRKRMLYERCDAAIILPGGYGTLDEVFEILTWNQLNIHQKDIFFLDSGGFYEHLIRHIEFMRIQGFLYEAMEYKLTVLKEPEELLPYL